MRQFFSLEFGGWSLKEAISGDPETAKTPNTKLRTPNFSIAP